MEFLLPENIKKFFWLLFPFITILVAMNNIFNNWQLQHYGFNELEDFGRLLFVFALSVCESALIIVILWWLKNLYEKIFVKQ